MIAFALVLPLLAERYPTAIAGLVIAVIVFSLYRQIVAVAIGDSPIAKRFKREPILENPDAPSAIVDKRFAPRIAAPCFHAGPDSVKASVTLAMRLLLNEPIIRSPTTARFGVAIAQKFTNCNHLAPTRAMTAPQRLFVSASDAFDRSQSSKRLASNIYQSGQGDLLQRLLRQVAGRCFNADPLRILACGFPP